MNTTVNRSLIINLVVAAALVLFAIWIMNNTYWAEETVHKGLSGEAEGNPFYSAQHLSDSLGAHSEWKHVLGDLPSANAIIVLSNWNWDVIDKRREQLQSWVEQGGRLILDESLITDESSLKEWSGIEYKVIPSKHKDGEDDEEEESAESSADSHGDVCEKLHLIDHRPDADPNRSSYQLCNLSWGRFITSAQPVTWGIRNLNGLQAVRASIGKGSVTLFNGTPFDNRELLKGEHGLLFVAATQLHRDDQIYFMMDEQGIPLLNLIWLYGSPVVVLVLLLIAAALWRNGTRFGPLSAQTDGARRSLGEQITGTGHFILRFNGGQALHAAAVRALADVARLQVLHYERLNSQDQITALSAATDIEYGALNDAIHYRGSRRTAELRHAITLLEHARRQLLNSKQTNNHTNTQTGSSHAS